MSSEYEPLAEAEKIDTAVLRNLDKIAQLAIACTDDSKTFLAALKIALDCQKLAVVITKQQTGKLSSVVFDSLAEELTQ